MFDIPIDLTPGAMIVMLLGLAIGAFASQASFELELTTGALHYAMYLATTIVLRLLMGMSPHWNH